jgi:glutathione synthase/RimK-type ligase-like ATP-grasp enzyme
MATEIKKIGILHGKENTFPQAFVEAVNKKAPNNIIAEAVQIERVAQGESSGYAVIIDRISQDVPFYKAYLKNAALCDTAVINNPFWWSADEKFFNNALATQVGVPVPKTILLPSHVFPPDTNENSFRNLFGSFKWEGNIETIGFPAFMKPHAGGGWKSVYKLNHMGDFYAKHPQTGQLVMLFQEAIDFTDYFRCYCLDRQYVKIMAYEPRNPHHLRYVAEHAGQANKKLMETIKDYVLRLNHALGYDFNTVEFAIRDGIPYAIDFCNPAPDADVHSVGQENFDWVVENASKMAIDRAKAHKSGQSNLTWGTYMQNSVAGLGMQVPTVAKEAPKAKKKVSEEKPTEVVAEKNTPAKKPTTKKVKA